MLKLPITATILCLGWNFLNRLRFQNWIGERNKHFNYFYFPSSWWACTNQPLSSKITAKLLNRIVSSFGPNHALETHLPRWFPVLRPREGLLCGATASCISARWAMMLLYREFPFPQELPGSSDPRCNAVKEKGQRANANAYRQLSWETGAIRFVDQHHTLSFTFFFNESFLNYNFYLSVSLCWLDPPGAGTKGTLNGTGDIKLISFCGGRRTRKQHFK